MYQNPLQALSFSHLARPLSGDDDAVSRGSWDHESLAQIRIKVFRGHKEACTSCQFCGQHEEKLLTAGEDALIKLWDFEQGTCLHTYTDGHDMNVTKARASPDNRTLVSSSWDRRVNLWDMETGKVLWTGHHDGMVTCCNFSQDGKYVVSGSDFDNSLTIWDAFSGETIAHVDNFHASTITSVTFNPVADRVVTTSMDWSAKFFDLRTHVNTITLKHHKNVVSDACFTRDERKLATVSWDKNIAYYDISTGMYRSDGPTVFERAHDGCISCCQFSHDGSILVTGGYDCSISIFECVNNVQKLKLQGHEDWVEDVVVRRDMKYIMTASRDKTIRVWDVENADRIPVVMQKKKNAGLSMYKCQECGKPFSQSDDIVEDEEETRLCVFCRLEQVRRRDAEVDSSSYLLNN